MFALFFVFFLGVKQVSSLTAMHCAVHQISSIVPVPKADMTKPSATAMMRVTNAVTVTHVTNTTVPCDSGYCFALWQSRVNGTKIMLKKGCWIKSADCMNTQCQDGGPSQHYRHFTNSRFCCCNGNLCNLNISSERRPSQGPEVRPESTRPPRLDSATLQRLSKAGLRDWFVSFQNVADRIRHKMANITDTVKVVHILDPHYRQRTIIISLVSICCLAILVIIVYLTFRICSCRRHDNRYHTYLTHVTLDTPPGLPVDDVTLQTSLSCGRFSEVWRATLKGREIAAKVYAPHNYKYFKNEREIYTLPLMSHDNLLELVGCSDTIPDHTLYILALTYYPHGSLTSYLRGNTLDFATLCRMCSGIASGLAYLHSDVQSNGARKPPIAHRDLNSRNILVRDDLSCVIADFGLSLTTFGPKVYHNGHARLAEESSITDVGTLRYMAPEVLDGAVNLRDCEASLKQIDVYSLGLVMWELATRCRDLYSPSDDLSYVMGEYQLPYAAMICSHPTFEEMQKIVCQQKLRPAFPSHWQQHNPVTTVLRETIEESWDSDGEARLTALCVQKRVSEMGDMWGVKDVGLVQENDDSYRDSRHVSTNDSAPCMATIASPLSQTIPPNADLRQCDICCDCDIERMLKHTDSSDNGGGIQLTSDPSKLSTNHTHCLSHRLQNFMLQNETLNVPHVSINQQNQQKSKLAFFKKTFNLGISGLTSLFRSHQKNVDGCPCDDNCYIGLESASGSPEDNPTRDVNGFGAPGRGDKMDTLQVNDASEQLSENLLAQCGRISECESLSGDVAAMRQAIGGNCEESTGRDSRRNADMSDVSMGSRQELSKDVPMRRTGTFSQSRDSSSGVLSSLSDDSVTIKSSAVDGLHKVGTDLVGYELDQDPHRSRFDSGRLTDSPSRLTHSQCRLTGSHCGLTDSQCSLSNSSCVESMNSSDSQYSSVPRHASLVDILKKRFSSDDERLARSYSPIPDCGDGLPNNTKHQKLISTRLSLYNDRVMCMPVIGGTDQSCSPAHSVGI